MDFRLVELLAMRTFLTCLLLFVPLSHVVSAQAYLVPDTGAFVDPDSYLIKNRHVFAQAFEEEVILRALVLRSFRDEYALGIKVDGEKVEAFVLEPSSNIWATELLEVCQDEIKALAEAGKQIPPVKLEELKELRERAPEDYRAIKATRRARPLSRELAEEIKAVWEKMLLDVRHSKKVIIGMDGVTYHFSTWIQLRGEISGHVWSPDSKSRTASLAALAVMLGDYARGKADLDSLKKKLELARDFPNP